jgi:hypothetical protein
MDFVRRLHAQDLAAAYAAVFLPRQLEKKYKNAAREFIWQWFFPHVMARPGLGVRGPVDL